MFDITAAAEKLQLAGATPRLPLNRRPPQLATNRTLLPDRLERRGLEIAATQLGDASHRCGRIDAAVRIDTQTVPAGAGEIVLHACPSIHAETELLHVVDGHTHFPGGRSSATHSTKNRIC